VVNADLIPVHGYIEIDKVGPTISGHQPALLFVQVQDYFFAAGIQVDGEFLFAVVFNFLEAPPFIPHRVLQKLPQASLTEGQVRRAYVTIDFDSHDRSPLALYFIHALLPPFGK
jgi:hypothetical protein